MNIPADADFISLDAGQFLYEAKAIVKEDPDAYCGKASYYEYSSKDRLNLIVQNWMDGVTLTKFDLTEKVLPRDGKYHWIKIGRVKFTNNGRSHLLIPDHCQGLRLEFFRRVVPGTVCDLYVSHKYTPESVKSHLSAHFFVVFRSHTWVCFLKDSPNCIRNRRLHRIRVPIKPSVPTGS